MPARNRVKHYEADVYYHVYNRGTDKQAIFHDEADYFYMLSLFRRHLAGPKDGDIQRQDKYGRKFVNFADEIELAAFCLMPTHFHLLVYLKQPEGLVHLMRSVMTAYTMYFNRKYHRTGGLYQGVFLAVPIRQAIYLWHVGRYIHLDPTNIGEDYTFYPFSSLDYFAGKKKASWLHEDRLVASVAERNEYLDFVADYLHDHKEHALLRNLLAAE